MKKMFDCVAMKEDIQKQMLKQMEGLSSEQRRVAVRDALEKSRSPVGELWRTLERRVTADVTCIAEAGEAYGGDAERNCKGANQ